MQVGDYKKLENNKALKRIYLNKTLWWLKLAMLSPVLLIFIGLAGVIHFIRLELTSNYFMYAYAAVFILGLIWLKYVKRYLQDKALTDVERINIVPSLKLTTKSGRDYLLFLQGDKRHNEALLKKLKESIVESSIDEAIYNKAKKVPQHIELLDDSSLYLTAIGKVQIIRAYKNSSIPNFIPLILIDKKEVFAIKAKDINKYLK